MDNLEGSRAEIDRIDREMARLFEQRMQAVEGVARYKAQVGKPVLDAARERAVIEKNLAYLKKEELKPYFRRFLQAAMAVSRDYQRWLLSQDVAAYQGAEGAWSHIALLQMFPQARPLRCHTFQEVFQAVDSGQASLGVLPFENSNAGDVTDVLDLCYAYPELNVVQSCALHIQQDLLAVPGAQLADIRTVISHPQALSQCADYLSAHGLKTQEGANTALAARQVASLNRKDTAAIASRQTAELYGLQVLEPAINTDRDNATRFIVISKQKPTAGDLFSLLFTVPNKPGTLARVIRTISEEGFNLQSIKSRPMPHVPFEYYFFVELVGDRFDEKSHILLEKLEQVCSRVRVLGVYSRQNDEDQTS